MATKSYMLTRDKRICQNCGRCEKFFRLDPCKERYQISEANYHTRGIRRIIYNALANCPSGGLGIEIKE